MKKKVYVQLLGATVLALILGCTSVMAKQSTENIQVSYSNIKMVVNGVPVEPKDANGSKIEPFIYNGTTYLPVRAVGDAFGQQVTWDGNTKTVYIGDAPNSNMYLTDVCPPYESSDECTTYLSSNGDSFKMSGESYSNGFTFYADNATAYFNLNGKYKTLSFYLGKEDTTGYSYDSNGKITFIVDGKTIGEFDVNAHEIPKKISIPLNNGLQLKIVATSEDFWEPTIGMGNVIVD